MATITPENKMSFMFKPYPYVDPQAINRPELPPSVSAELTAGNAAVAAKLLDGFTGVLALDGYVGADFTELLTRLREQREVTVLNVSDAYKSSAELEEMLGERDGESRMGAITLGTGIGAAVIVDNELLVNDLGSPATEASLWDKPSRGTTVEKALDLRNHGPGQTAETWQRFGELLAEILTPWSERFQLETIVIGGQVANDFELFQEPLKHLPVRKPIRKHAALYGAAKQFLEEKAK